MPRELQVPLHEAKPLPRLLKVENIQNGTLTVVTSYERLPTGHSQTLEQLSTRVLSQQPTEHKRQPEFRADLGPNLVAYKRIDPRGQEPPEMGRADKMLDELQRSLGTAQAEKNARNSIERLNANHNLSGLLLPGTPFSSALYDDITESSQAAIKWDPLQRPKPNEQADISKASRERDIGASPYAPKGPPPPTSVTDRLNPSQKEAARYVLELRRRFSLIQGPPGTGKTTTAVATICGWLRSRRGPVLATAFSNRGVDNMAEALHKLGVRVLRVGLCRAEKPYSLETRLAECGERRGNKGMAAVLSRMDVVAATCIGVGMGPLDKHVFPYVVVDEAAQVIEPAVILPLGKGAVQAVMVGDQCQLPATVLSQEAQRRGLDVSMFDRLLSMGMEYQVLKEQYRMHPQIAAFPSWRFYRSELNSAVTASARQLPARLQLRSPLVFLHIDAMEQAGGASKKNPAEAACVSWLVEQVLRRAFPCLPSEPQPLSRLPLLPSCFSSSGPVPAVISSRSLIFPQPIAPPTVVHANAADVIAYIPHRPRACPIPAYYTSWGEGSETFSSSS
ncbi:unnamed protein product [Prorocentrum cordatum]|uniref:RNA helicase n=1 Tax=Prorocentrum cordatum TaxID=2364126 RepID=A0ABN9TQS7_9DINO|nr:unnamed protein product [Polarella glacialis]